MKQKVFGFFSPKMQLDSLPLYFWCKRQISKLNSPGYIQSKKKMPRNLWKTKLEKTKRQHRKPYKGYNVFLTSPNTIKKNVVKYQLILTGCLFHLIRGPLWEAANYGGQSEAWFFERNDFESTWQALPFSLSLSAFTLLPYLQQRIIHLQIIHHSIATVFALFNVLDGEKLQISLKFGSND